MLTIKSGSFPSVFISIMNYQIILKFKTNPDFISGTLLNVCIHMTISISTLKVRKELIDLQQSRLYHHAKERHKFPHKKHSDDQSQPVTIPMGAEPEGPITPGTKASGTEGPNTPGTQASSAESGSTPSSKKPIIHEDL